MSRVLVGTLFVSILALGLTAEAQAQKLIGSALLLTNQGSRVSIENPNTNGNYVLRLPEMPNLAPGETQNLVLQAVGTPGGPVVQFVDPLAPATLIQTDETDVHDKPVALVVHAFAEVDLPPVAGGESFVWRVEVQGIKAGAAITVSPAGEMPTGIHPAYAFAPIDCVVFVKFINMSNTPVDVESMQFSIGAINP